MAHTTRALRLPRSRSSWLAHAPRILGAIVVATRRLRTWWAERIDAAQLGPAADVDMGRHTGARV